MRQDGRIRAAFRRIALPVLATLLILPGGAARATPTGLDSLDYAFRFASAIQKDPKDRAKAQELVIGEYLRIGALDGARRLAGEVVGWRRGTVYADLAAMLARRGRIEEARELVAKAEEIRQSVGGWEAQRILAHTGQALAALGDREKLDEIASDLATGDPIQYTGRATALLASGDAARGDINQALQRLDSLPGDDIDVSWWRTAGYLEVARQESLSKPDRLRALDAAGAAAEKIPGWKRAEALESIAEEYQRLDRRDKARKALRSAEATLGTSPEAPVQAPLLSNLAEAWARIGDSKRARKLLKRAEPAVAASMGIDQPGIYANLASSYLHAGDAAEAERLYDRALEAAAGLTNARPRALAVTSVCRQMGRNGVEPNPETKTRLDALLAGLVDPW